VRVFSASCRRPKNHNSRSPICVHSCPFVVQIFPVSHYILQFFAVILSSSDPEPRTLPKYTHRSTWHPPPDTPKKTSPIVSQRLTAFPSPQTPPYTHLLVHISGGHNSRPPINQGFTTMNSHVHLTLPRSLAKRRSTKSTTKTAQYYGPFSVQYRPRRSNTVYILSRNVQNRPKAYPLLSPFITFLHNMC
jgi:hypothetical protein